MLPTWSPPHTDNSASKGEDDDLEPDPDGNGGGQNGHKNDGQLVPTGNHGIMTIVDAGENNRVDYDQWKSRRSRSGCRPETGLLLLFPSASIASLTSQRALTLEHLREHRVNVGHYPGRLNQIL
jgi:hypothetical protein